MRRRVSQSISMTSPRSWAQFGLPRLSERRQLRPAALAIPLSRIVQRPTFAALERLVDLAHVGHRIERARRLPVRRRRITGLLFRSTERKVVFLAEVDDRLFTRAACKARPPRG